MTGIARTSIVIVSRHRPLDLIRCLTALLYQDHSDFEVIVVADPTGVAAIRQTRFEAMVKMREFDEPNISAARNIGISLASAEIIAFLDDDAFAEPTWLSRIVSVFGDNRVTAAAGFVRSRNGISYRWRGDRILPWGELVSFVAKGPTVYPPDTDQPVLTIGANCAFRRDALTAIGGFDPNFRMGLDDADVNVRLTRAGGYTAIVPSAEVHHVPGASAYRSGRQVPLSLEENGASFGWWLKKYERPENDYFRLRDALRNGFLSLRLLRGDIEPEDMAKLLMGLDRGFAAGKKRTALKSPTLAVLEPYSKFQTNGSGVTTFITGHFTQRVSLFAKARNLASVGDVVTVLMFSRTAMFHRRWFHSDGFWVQSGGVYGRSVRSSPLFRRSTIAKRAKAEANDISLTRMVQPLQNNVSYPKSKAIELPC